MFMPSGCNVCNSRIQKLSSLYPRSPKGEGGILFYLCPSFHTSKIFFVACFSVTVDGRNLIFRHKLHIGIPYCGRRFWTRQIPTSCLTGPKSLPTIWHTYMKLVTKYQIPVINSCLEKCDEKCALQMYVKCV
jgi:hypothetical protein